MNLFDIMRQAGGGDAFAELARQFGLSEEQIGKAVEAFMPAFSAGLKRSTGDPLGLMQLMQKLSMGSYPEAYRNPAWAFGPGQQPGQEALSFLFGSPEAVRALAAQAAAFTGLSPDKLAAMLPALASMVFGGLAQQAARANPMFEALLQQMQVGAAPAAKGPLDRYEEEQAARGESANLGQAQAEMMKAGMAAFQANAAAWQRAMSAAMSAADDTGPKSPMPKSGPDLFGEMFEPGRRLGEAYQREMEALLRRFGPGGGRP
jgi:hypothetical protein